MKSPRLTPAIRQHVLASVRAGAYPHVAAEAWGIPRNVLGDWLAKGEGPRAREPYASFAIELRTAHAQARLLAEKNVFDKEPKVWLEHGPGREQPERPGWTSTVKPAEPAVAPTANAWLQPEFLRVVQALLEVLAPFPEARGHAARVLTQLALEPAGESASLPGPPVA